jgi:glycosyltransferase involved in cell wall biosynthesis
MEEMLQAMADRGHEVVIIVPRVHGLVEGRRKGVTVVGVPYAPASMQVWGYGRSLDAGTRLRSTAIAVTPLAMTAMARALGNETRARRPDIVHLHWLLPQGVLSAVVPKGVPIVVSLHGADVRFATGPLAPITRWVVDRVAVVVAASSGVIELVSQVAPKLKEKAVVIPHGANDKLFYPRDRAVARAELGIEHNGSIILGVGRLVPKKGFRHLIAAMASLSETGAHLHLVGDGPERSALEDAVTHDLRPRLHFQGRQSREKVAQWIAASDVVVIPSVPDKGDIDSGPVVLMEAMASGRPVVSSRVGMAQDVIVNNENGLLLDVVDEVAIAETIRRALTKRDELGRNARHAFVTEGGWPRVAETYEQTYRQLRA